MTSMTDMEMVTVTTIMISALVIAILNRLRIILSPVMEDIQTDTSVNVEVGSEIEVCLDTWAAKWKNVQHTTYVNV